MRAAWSGVGWALLSAQVIANACAGTSIACAAGGAVCRRCAIPRNRLGEEGIWTTTVNASENAPRSVRIETGRGKKRVHAWPSHRAKVDLSCGNMERRRPAVVVFSLRGPVPTGCVRFAHPPENLRLRKGLSQQQALQRQAVDLRQLLQILHFHVFVELVDGGVPRAYFHYLRADVGDEAAVRSAAGC